MSVLTFPPSSHSSYPAVLAAAFIVFVLLQEAADTCKSTLAHRRIRRRVFATGFFFVFVLLLQEAADTCKSTLAHLRAL
jgi:hypothetical protein